MIACLHIHTTPPPLIVVRSFLGSGLESPLSRRTVRHTRLHRTSVIGLRYCHEIVLPTSASTDPRPPRGPWRAVLPDLRYGVSQSSCHQFHKSMFIEPVLSSQSFACQQPYSAPSAPRSASMPQASRPQALASHGQTLQSRPKLLLDLLKLFECTPTTLEKLLELRRCQQRRPTLLVRRPDICKCYLHSHRPLHLL